MPMGVECCTRLCSKGSGRADRMMLRRSFRLREQLIERPSVQESSRGNHGIETCGVGCIQAIKENTLQSCQVNAVFLPVRAVYEEQPFPLEMFETISHRLRSPLRQKR